jgi:hypothetical protein
LSAKSIRIVYGRLDGSPTVLIEDGDVARAYEFVGSVWKPVHPVDVAHEAAVISEDAFHALRSQAGDRLSKLGLRAVLGLV